MSFYTLKNHKLAIDHLLVDFRRSTMVHARLIYNDEGDGDAHSTGNHE